jgi:adenylosuccinate synthase
LYCRGALQNGVPYNKIRNVYGIAKAYRTYVGNKNFEKPSPIFETIREVGKEYGATTGRPRQIDWFNLDDIKKAININGVTHLIINKLDVLESVKEFNLITNGGIGSFSSKDLFKDYIIHSIKKDCLSIKEIIFSETPYDI